MVIGLNNNTYLSLYKRFEKVSGYRSIVETVLSEWENDGIESAMKIYNFKENEQV
jgi:hypothetical protein